MRLDVQDLTVVRGGRLIFERIGFAINAGDALTLTGPNGSGKSTLLRALAGLIEPEGGRIVLGAEGRDPEDPASFSAHYAGHLDAVKPSLTVLENLAFWQDFLGSPRLEPRRALERLGIDHIADFPAAYCSQGQRRRLALARLIAAHRPLWLLDEPTAALDAASEKLLAMLMAEHRAEGGMVIVATHSALDLPDSRRFDLGTGREEAA